MKGFAQVETASMGQIQSQKLNAKSLLPCILESGDVVEMYEDVTYFITKNKHLCNHLDKVLL